jgi:hypothetical protein
VESPKSVVESSGAVMLFYQLHKPNETKIDVKALLENVETNNF